MESYKRARCKITKNIYGDAFVWICFSAQTEIYGHTQNDTTTDHNRKVTTIAGRDITHRYLRSSFLKTLRYSHKPATREYVNIQIVKVKAEPSNSDAMYTPRNSRSKTIVMICAPKYNGSAVNNMESHHPIDLCDRLCFFIS